MASIKVAYKESAFPLIPSLIENANSHVAHNKEIIRHLIDITLFLGRHCLSFRGHKEGKQEDTRGNFKDLAILIAKYSPALSSHITEVEIKGKKTNNFLSWQRQNQLIQAISTNIKNVIQQELLNAKYFSISLDTTFDISRKEQLTIVFRYINKGIVCERLLAVRETVLTTGQHLFTMFNEICEEMKLNWREHLVGQSFDGAASMRGSYNGLQAFIREQNPCAIYVWCWAHRFSLVIIDAVSSCSEARDLFGNLEFLFDFIGSSKKRIGLYSNFQNIRYPGKPQRRLKRVTTTRWYSHFSALQTVIDTFDAIIDTLDNLHNDSTTDRVCSVKATSLMDYMLSERFVLTSLVFTKVFDITSPLSKFLQGKNVDLLAATNYVQNSLMKIEDLRNDFQFQNLIIQKDEFIELKKNDFSFTPLIQVRSRRIKKMPGELASDESLTEPINTFKIKTYITIIDIVTTQIKERFNENSTPLFNDLSLFQRKRIIEVERNNSSLPIDAFKGFENIYGKFITAKDLRLEYIQFANIYLKFENITKLPKYLHDNNDSNLHYDTDEEEENLDIDFNKSEEQKTINLVYSVFFSNGLKDIFPILYTALSIALTLPVSSSSPERAFSKLKIIKNRLRSTMSEDRLEALMLISCEKDISVCTDEIINIFSSNSSVLKKLLS